jgi:hypothetical protein
MNFGLPTIFAFVSEVRTMKITGNTVKQMKPMIHGSMKKNAVLLSRFFLVIETPPYCRSLCLPAF